MSAPRMHSQPTSQLSVILNRTDEEIKRWVMFIFTMHPQKISTAKTQLQQIITKAQDSLQKAEHLVTEGIYGYSNSQAEAKQKLYQWATGEMVEKITNLAAKMDAIAQETGSGSILDTASKPSQNPAFSQMQEIAKAYVKNDALKIKAELALTEFNRLEVEAKAQTGAHHTPQTSPGLK